MVDIEALQEEIVKRLKPLNPYRVILFGSYAYGKPTEDSDIDLYVVTNDEFMPRSFKEKTAVHLKVSQQLRDLLQTYPTDLITHTKAMHKRFLEIGTPFAQEITTKGKVLL